jgi:hypothetical protein
LKEELTIVADHLLHRIKAALERPMRCVGIEGPLNTRDMQPGWSAYREFRVFGLLPCASQQFVRHQNSVAAVGEDVRDLL